MKPVDVKEFFSKCVEHLAWAKEKHPRPYQFELLERTYDLNENAKWAKENGGENGRCPHVLLAECYEFLVEVGRGDYDRATEEAADVVAVLLRFLEQRDAWPKAEVEE